MSTTTVQIARTVTYAADLEVQVDPRSGQVDPDGLMIEVCNRLNADPNDPPLEWRLVGMNHDEFVPPDIHP